MSALTDRIYGLVHRGHNLFEIAEIVGLTPTEVSDRLRDPSLADPSSGTGIPGGGGGGGGALPQALYRQASLPHTDVYNPWQPSDAVYDDIGVTLDPDNLSFGPNMLIVPQGKYLAQGGIETFTQPDAGDGFLAVGLALATSGFHGEDFESKTSYNSVIVDSASAWSGVTVSGFFSADTDLSALDPSFAGLFGGVKIFSQDVRKISNGAQPVTPLDFNGWFIHLTKVG